MVEKRQTGASSPRKKTPSKPKIDWVAVRESFVQGLPQGDDSRAWPTLQELADIYNVSYHAVASHSSKERWAEQRASYQSDIETAKRQSRITDIVKKAQDIDDHALRMANLGASIITRRLAEIAEDQHRASQVRKESLEAADNGGMLDLSTLLPSIDAREVDALSKAGMAFIQLGQKAVGTDVIKHQISGDQDNPVEVRHSVTNELQRDDPDRLAGFLEVLNRTVGIENILPQSLMDGDVIDGEIVDGNE